MSKCDVSVVFDRAERTFLGGDTITGHVDVTSNGDVKCKWIRLFVYWKTHGRGNSERHLVETIDLSPARNLMPGEQVRLPFTVRAPEEPVTYRGHHLNIDHYVKAEVDVSWAINPHAEEDFIVQPGAAPAGFPDARDKVRDKTEEKPKQQAGLLLKLIGLLFLPLILALLIAFLPIILIVVIVRWAHRTVVERKVGKVTLKTPLVVVTPGEDLPVEISFTPRIDLEVNGITVKLHGRERCVSGSGSNRTTHHHDIHSETVQLAEQGLLSKAQPQSFNGSIRVPDVPAYSFKGSSNHMEWSAEVRIDLPRYPDWVEKVDLQLVPSSFVGRSAPGAPAPVARPKPAAESAAQDDGDASWGAAQHLPSPASVVAAVGASLPVVIRQLEEAGPFGEEREQLVASLADREFACTVQIDQALTTDSSVAEAHLRGGMTVVGVVMNTNRQVQLFTGAGEGGFDGLSRGDLWSGTVKVVSWDELYARPVLHEVSYGGE